MTILTLKFNRLILKDNHLRELLIQHYPNNVVVRMFISSLYSDTFSIEILLL